MADLTMGLVLSMLTVWERGLNSTMVMLVIPDNDYNPIKYIPCE